MLDHKKHLIGNEHGFTLVELLITITIIAVIGTTFFTAFKSTIFSYLGLQTEASSLTDLAYQSQRVASVMRNITNIDSVAANDMVMYSYFSPTDAFVSQVHYYLSADKTKLYADVIPMTANPPTGSLITAQKKTFTIISDFKQTAGVNLFGYLSASGSTLALPITDLNTIKGVQVNLASTTTNKSTNQVISLQVSLRNRKANL